MTTDTRDPVAALHHALFLAGQQIPLVDVKYALTQLGQGYVLVNAEGLAAAIEKVFPYEVGDGVRVPAIHTAAAILAAIQEQQR